MERGGKTVEHQRTGTSCSRAGNQNFHKGRETILHSHEDRQHERPVLPPKNGGNREPRHDQDYKKDLVLPSAARDHDYCGMDPISSEHNSGLGVQACVGIHGMEALPNSLPSNVPEIGESRHGSLCLQGGSPTGAILQLDGRSRLRGNRCILPRLGPAFSIRLPAILSHYKGLKTGTGAVSGENDNGSPTVAIPTMVSFTSGHGSSTTHSPTTVPRTSAKPIRFSSPVTSKFLSKPSGLATIRDRLEGEGVSTEASDLILNSRRESTTKNYESTWKQWILWCRRRGVDPITCPLRHVLDYLASMFQDKEYRTIGVHRSAISAYHIPIDGFAVGQHPTVSDLMSGVANLRPPKPKYGFTWDVELVLNLFRSWPDRLTAKQLTLKTATLLGLIAISRGAEIHLLDLNFLNKFHDFYRFGLAGTVKNVKAGKKPTPIEFHRHEEDPKLCPLQCLDDYISLTETWRKEGVPSSLFLSFVAPHGPISKSRLAGWVKEVLHLAGINTDIFQAHSLRGAASSQAYLKGLSIKEVLNQGSWSRESTWQKYYHKQVVPISKKFQDGVLKL